MKSNYAVSRRVTKQQEIVYACGEIRGVVNTPRDGKRDLLVVVPSGALDDVQSQRADHRRRVEAMVVKAKARDGIATHQLYNNHVFNELADGRVQIVAIDLAHPETVA